MKKRVLAALLSAAMVASLAACGSTGTTSTDSSTASSGTEAASSDEAVAGTSEIEYAAPTVSFEKPEQHYKIAYSYYSFSDKLGMQFKESLEYLADAFNCEFVFFESGSGDEAVTNIESVLAAGDIDGVIYVGATPSVVAVAEKYQVPYVAVCGFPSTDEEVATDASYEYFLGGIVDDDVWAGNHCIQALYDAGCRNICLSGATQGLVKSHDDRAAAYRAFMAEHSDVNNLTESYTMMETANDISTFAASFPTMDGIMFTAGSDTIYLTMESEGIADGSVKIAAVDISSQSGTYFQNGVQVWSCGGQYGTSMTGFAVLYHYLTTGEDVITDKATPITRQYIEITSYDDYVNYVNLVETDVPVYTADEIYDMATNWTLEDYQAEADSWSLDLLASRR